MVIVVNRCSLIPLFHFFFLWSILLYSVFFVFFGFFFIFTLLLQFFCPCGFLFWSPSSSLSIFDLFFVFVPCNLRLHPFIIFYFFLCAHHGYCFLFLIWLIQEVEVVKVLLQFFLFSFLILFLDSVGNFHEFILFINNSIVIIFNLILYRIKF